MPLYEYRCKNCEHQFEKIQSFSAPEEKECPECGGPVEKLLSAPAVQFKGTGWYVTDYAGKGGGSKKSAAGESAKSGESRSGEKSASSGDAGSSSKPAASPAKSDSGS